MKITYKNTQNFAGNALRISNGFLDLELAKDIGPRILYFGKKDGENLLFNDIKDEITKDVSSVYGEGQKWHIYGGHRLWLSPESLYTYYPDNNPVEIIKIENGAIIKAQRQNIVDVEISVKVEFVGENSLRLTHKVKNLGEKKRVCLWGLTVMKAGYKMTLELDKTIQGLLPNRNIVLWPYSDINDKRLKIENSRIELLSDKKVSKPFKIGTYNQHIKAQYHMGKDVFEKSFLGYENEDYPDFHCNFECYISDKIHEIESLSMAREIEKNKEIEFCELWSLKRG